MSRPYSAESVVTSVPSHPSRLQCERVPSAEPRPAICYPLGMTERELATEVVIRSPIHSPANHKPDPTEFED